MQLTVVSLSQDVSFEDGSVTNFVVLRTPLGQVLRAVVTDDSAKVLVEALAAQTMGTSSAATPSEDFFVNEVDEEAHVFGGETWLPSVQPTPVTEAPAEEARVWLDPSAQARDYREKQKAQKEAVKRGRNRTTTVGRDSLGYPVVNTPGGADPGELVGSSSALDEDGIGSI